MNDRENWIVVIAEGTNKGDIIYVSHCKQWSEDDPRGVLPSDVLNDIQITDKVEVFRVSNDELKEIQDNIKIEGDQGRIAKDEKYLKKQRIEIFGSHKGQQIEVDDIGYLEKIKRDKLK